MIRVVRMEIDGFFILVTPRLSSISCKLCIGITVNRHFMLFGYRISNPSSHPIVHNGESQSLAVLHQMDYERHTIPYGEAGKWFERAGTKSTRNLKKMRSSFELLG